MKLRLKNGELETKMVVGNNSEITLKIGTSNCNFIHVLSSDKVSLATAMMSRKELIELHQTLGELISMIESD